MAKAARDQAAAFLQELAKGARVEDIEAARALRDEAQAALRLAEAQAREMEIVAPASGVVESIDVEPGDLVRPGPLARVTKPDDLELLVYVSGPMLGHIRLSQPVRLTTDSFPGESFASEVIFIAHEGEYTPRNLQTQEQRAFQMFAVKLRLSSAGERLKPGMWATAHFDLDHKEAA